MAHAQWHHDQPLTVGAYALQARGEVLAKSGKVKHDAIGRRRKDTEADDM
jgi:hypothetical protein